MVVDCPAALSTVCDCLLTVATTATRTATEAAGGSAVDRAVEGLVRELPNLVTVGLGGFLATLGWRLWRRPRLTVPDDGVSVVPSAPNDQTREYRVRVENTGNRAAENCKPRLDLTVETDGVVTDVSTLCKWAEEGTPARTTINVGETAEFVLLEYDEAADRVRFPAGDGSDGPANVLRYDSGDGRATDDAVPCIAVGARELVNGSTDTQEVRVAAENASAAECSVLIQDPEEPDSSDEHSDVNEFQVTVDDQTGRIGGVLRVL